MKQELHYFKTEAFYSALQTFFKSLNVPLNYIAEEPAKPQDILSNTYKKDHPAFQLMDDVYFLGMVDDAAFEGNVGLNPEKIESDYDGILIFGVTLKPRDNGLLPTRTQLAEITRSFNREYHYTPVVVVFKYENHIAFANAERLKYKQEWREGEKAGKVSLLRDIDLDDPHSGHLRILSELAISRSGKKAVNSFADLYTYWQTVFNVSVLNKKFYEELSNWYFWAVKEVTFPSKPTMEDVVKESGKIDGKRLEELKQEHNAKNVIRLLTRFLFVWFVKEKKLIPGELFDLEYLKKEMLKDLSPYHDDGLFKEANIASHYYKAVLQNLFFATLNQEMGKRAFRKDKQNMNVTNLLRYESCFKDPQKFISLVESTVPFMNGGLFECLDKPHPTKKGPQGGDVVIYKDGFSDRNDNQVKVPDYLFFGVNEEVDLSSVIGITNKKTKQAAVKGLINIFESYKFTIAENTPIEEDIALDPELLGKVFENLLASYNPETKTTARKQTGSFYTPREIVNYMVDESLIAYLKSSVKNWDMPEDDLDTQLHQLFSFDATNPFSNNQPLQSEIIKALDHCTILDPACGSGAFPMGILQKMVHILQKVDPENMYWHELQMEKAMKDTESAFHLVDKEVRKQKLIEINEAFDSQVNDPDYARKLFLIENCIYGVDIQPIAVQVSKLRSFISLVVDQKVDKSKDNFGIRPLPNLETKFVTANTLIDIDKPESLELFDNPKIEALEKELKSVRHRIFSAKTPRTKRKLREEDQKLREKMGELLIADGWENKTARQLSSWDPYDQNASSSFFDVEWMFGIKGGFDVVIGNPPYGFHHIHTKDLKTYFKKNYQAAIGSFENYFLFYEKSLNLLKVDGAHSFIVPVTWLTIPSAYSLRKFILSEFHVSHITWLNDVVFENAQVNNLVSLIERSPNDDVLISNVNDISNLGGRVNDVMISQNKFIKEDYYMSIFENKIDTQILNIISNVSTPMGELCNPCSGYNPYEVGKGIAPNGKPHTKQTVNEKPYHSPTKIDNDWKPEIIGRNLSRYNVEISGKRWVKYGPWLAAERNPENFLGKRILVQEIVGGSEKRIIASFYEGELYHSRDVIPIRMNYNSPHPYLLLSIINSTLLTWYHHKRSPKAKKGLFPKVLVSDLKKFPIAKSRGDNIVSQLILLVKLILYVTSEGDKFAFLLFDEVIDGLVFELYFLDHMKAKKIDILQSVSKDLTEVIHDNVFEKLPSNERRGVITQLHSRWTHPDSEVRNRIKLFAVRSPEILKPILESK